MYRLELRVLRDDPEADALHEMTGIPNDTRGEFEFEGDFPKLSEVLDFLEGFVSTARPQIPDEL